MKKEELSKISDEQLNKEIDEQEDFVLLEWMYQERENRTNL